MYAIELLMMIQKFERKYPTKDLKERGLFIENKINGSYINGYIASYEVGLEYIKFKLRCGEPNEIFIPELKSILEKNKYKKIHIDVGGEILTEISYIAQVYNLCYFTYEDLTLEVGRRYITRKEI